MKKIYLSTLFLASLFFSLVSSAQNRFFTEVAESKINISNATRVIIPQKFKTVALDKQAMKSFLWSLPKEASVLHKLKETPVLELPMPDGRTARFNVWESSIQEPGLEAKFPEIRTFAGQGIDDPYATIRFDYTPNGFHAQVLTVNGTYYIDPYAKGNTTDYMSYFRSDYMKAGSFTCGVSDNPATLASRNPVPEAACRGTQMNIYRLAVACTGEYAQAPGIAAGTNAATLHAAIVTTVNRVVGVYERDITVRLVLIANNNVIEYLNAATDPFNGNNNANTLIIESQTVIDANIGTANYDIGHTFSTGGGGLATLNSPCNAGTKARGITGSPQPTGDAYDIDYVAHEMGHQFGGNHTMAGCGASPNSTKLEVGSGTSIQAYAGICGTENIQPNSDPFFHSKSFDEISNFLSGFGSSCGTTQPTGNNIPVIDLLPNGGVTIPINTPFTLTGSATDPDGDPLIYSWEQQDFAGTATWNAGATAPANNTVPLFKMRLPKTVGSRTFPDPAVINANFPANPPSAMNGLKGETLSPVARAMTFRFIARDSKAAGGGVASSGSGGCQSAPTYQVNVSGSAPFVVTAPNGGESFPGGTTQTVTWNVVGTNAAPFNTANVRISISTDGGLTYPTELLASTPNDGSQAVVLPSTPTTTAKIKVEAVGNIFFDVSNNNFTITQPVNGFTLNATTPATVTCGVTAAPSVTLATTVVGTFTTPIVLSATAGVPAGTTVSFGTNPVTPGASSTVTLNNANTLANGTYNITVTGTAGTTVQTATVTFTVSGGTAPTVATPPANQTVCAPAAATFTVTGSGSPVTSYQWQLNTGAGFNNIAGATTASYTTAATTGAMNGYQYRVILNGQCGSTTSAAATLTVNTAPAITTQPANTTVCAGNNAVFNVVATGAGLTYQWQLNTGSGFNNIAGATAASYTVTGVTLGQSGHQYQVIVSGTCGSPVTSSVATVTVGNEANITTQPTSLVVCVGDAANFSVVATGSSITYQWQVNTGSGFADIPGATSATYNAGPATAAQNGYQYRANVFSCTPTPIQSNTVTLTVNIPVAVTTQPVASVICAGANTSFSATVAGTANSYVWQYNTSGCSGTAVWQNVPNTAPYSGVNTATLTITGATAAMNGYAYRLVTTNSCNNVTSSCVTLTVNSPIVVTTQPANTSVCLPTNTASFSVVVTGTAPTYQWQVNTGSGFANIAGATSATLNLTGLTAAANGYQYRVVLSGTCSNSFNSNAATLTVNSPVAITDQPDDLRICEGANASFSVTATGSTITYQWQSRRNGGPFGNVTNGGFYTGATTATLNITNASVALNGYEFRVVVSGVPCGAVNSDTVSLTVNALPGVVLVAAETNTLTPYNPAGLYSTVSPAGTYTYTWYRNGDVVTGQTGSSIEPVTVDWFGQYYVRVTNAEGCSKNSNIVTLRDSVSNLVFIYPNPSQGVFQVRYYAPNPTEYSLNVYDARGARVWSKKYPAAARYEQMLVDLGRNASGTYIVEVRSTDERRLATGRVVIQR